MIAFEQLVGKTQAELTEFANDCAECFSTPSGRRVLSALVAAAHPLEHTPGLSDHEHGRREVVATLWRFGPTPILPKQHAPPTQ